MGGKLNASARNVPSGCIFLYIHCCFNTLRQNTPLAYFSVSSALCARIQNDSIIFATMNNVVVYPTIILQLVYIVKNRIFSKKLLFFFLNNLHLFQRLFIKWTMHVHFLPTLRNETWTYIGVITPATWNDRNHLWGKFYLTCTWLFSFGRGGLHFWSGLAIHLYILNSRQLELGPCLFFSSGPRIL